MISSHHTSDFWGNLKLNQVKRGEGMKKGEEEEKKVESVSPHLMLAALVKRSLFVRQQVDTSKVCLPDTII